MSEKKVVLITAASRGMGEACAREFHAKGFSLALMARGDEVKILASELNAFAFLGDVSKAQDLKAFVEASMKEFGRIDVLVNNTGHSAKKELLELSDEDWHEGLDLLMLNVHRMAQLITPIMQKQGGGCMVNISTFAAFEPSLIFPVSSALRAALGSYTKLFADKYAEKNIRMNSVLPGFVDSKPVKEAIEQSIPMKRYAKMSEIAKTVSFLASEDAAYITGQNIRVDGSLTRSV